MTAASVPRLRTCRSMTDELGSLQRPVPFRMTQLQVLRLRSVAALPHFVQDDTTARNDRRQRPAPPNVSIDYRRTLHNSSPARKRWVRGSPKNPEPLSGATQVCAVPNGTLGENTALFPSASALGWNC
jgi:hypothetical protein